MKRSTVFVVTFFSLGSSILLAQNAPFLTMGKTDSGSVAVPEYEVSSVRQNLNPRPSWRMNFTNDGVSAKDVTLFYVIEEAYGIYDEQLWSGVPPWAMQKRFDIEAKYDVEKYPHIKLEQRMAMLQQLLEDRFKLSVHHEQKEFPIYSLEIAKGGPKFIETKSEDQLVTSVYGPMCQVSQAKMGLIELKGCSMQQLAAHLTSSTRDELGRNIVDQTELPSRYNLRLSWTPDSAPGSGTSDIPTGPSLFTALREQLGLLLKPSKGPLDTIVIDHVEMPTEN